MKLDVLQTNLHAYRNSRIRQGSEHFNEWTMMAYEIIDMKKTSKSSSELGNGQEQTVS